MAENRKQAGGNGPRTQEASAGELLSLARLAAAAQVPPRTVRYYMTRGLVPPPRKRGRQAVYGPEHLERLAEIKRLQAQGLSLAEIGAVLGAAPAALPRPDTWLVMTLAPDFVVCIPGGVGGFRKRQLLLAAQKAAEVLRTASGKEDDHGTG